MRGWWLLCSMVLLAGHAPADSGFRTLHFGKAALEVEVADTPAERQHGLMGRERLPASRGMLFVFERDAHHCLWMKNTPLPLSAAFLDARGRVLNLVELEPQALDLRCASGPARYAVEVGQGWFAEQGVEVGGQVEGLPVPDR